MALATGGRLGPYEIVASLGEGGMGEVYRAKDTRLDRTVAIKVLPAHVSQDPERKARFAREARAVSSLNHPNVCVLHDVGHHEGTDYIVMECLEGETLHDRLKKGALPLEQALKYGAEIADALDKAHRHGVVHRDLKPGNVMLTKTGPKLLDFGLAKIGGTASGASGLGSALATQDRPLTEKGAVLGTFQYMSPEQLEGGEADSRADIFAFGAVLYEMLTGQRPFTGKSQASLIGAILKDEPAPISKLQPLTPPALERLVKTCLAKDPDERWQSAHDVVAELRWILETARQVPTVPGTSASHAGAGWGRERMVWLSISLVLAALLAGVLVRGSRSGVAPRLVTSSIEAPAGATKAFFHGFALSGDGSRLAFEASSSEGRQIWVRSLARAAPTALAGTEGGTHPFWSPDGKDIGFFAHGSLRRVTAVGGPVRILCRADLLGHGGTWSADGSILFADDRGDGGIYRVSSEGGEPERLAGLAASTGPGWSGWPWLLPDGKRFLYVGSDLQLATLGAAPRSTSLGLPRRAAFVPPSHLVFGRDEGLFAQELSIDAARLVGTPTQLAETLSELVDWSAFSVANDGTLAYLSLNDLRQRLAWVDRRGSELGRVENEANSWVWGHRIARDGRRVALVRDRRGDASNVWVLDTTGLIRLSASRIEVAFPIWSPSDDRLVFSVWEGNGYKIYEKHVAADADPRLVFDPGPRHRGTIATDWSRDGRYVALTLDFAIAPDLAVYDMDRRILLPVLATEFAEMHAVFSPDGRYLAYQSDEGGAFDVYVRPFPATGGARRVSSAGGAHPRWRADGKELFFLAADGSVMAVDAKLQPTLELGTPRPLFKSKFVDLIQGTVSPYDVAADGQRFLLNVPTTDPPSLTLVQNWKALQER